MDLESGLFRILDEAVAGYLSARAERVVVRLDWSDQVEASVSASRASAEVKAAAGARHDDHRHATCRPRSRR